MWFLVSRLRPGKKDPEKVRAFVRAVREMDRKVEFSGWLRFAETDESQIPTSRRKKRGKDGAPVAASCP